MRHILRAKRLLLRYQDGIWCDDSLPHILRILLVAHYYYYYYHVPPGRNKLIRTPVLIWANDDRFPLSGRYLFTPVRCHARRATDDDAKSNGKSEEHAVYWPTPLIYYIWRLIRMPPFMSWWCDEEGMIFSRYSWLFVAHFDIASYEMNASAVPRCKIFDAHTIPAVRTRAYPPKHSSTFDAPPLWN